MHCRPFLGFPRTLRCRGVLFDFAQLLNYVVFGDWVLFALIVGTLFVYRSRDDAGANPDTFRMVGYPALPIIFILASFLVVTSTIGSMEPMNAVIGVGIILSGAGVYYAFRWAQEREAVGT